MSADSILKHKNTWSEDRVPRREAIKVAGALLLSGLLYAEQEQTKRAKTVIVTGAGIAGLSCCAYELVRRGHEVTVGRHSKRTIMMSDSSSMAHDNPTAGGDKHPTLACDRRDKNFFHDSRLRVRNCKTSSTAPPGNIMVVENFP